VTVNHGHEDSAARACECRQIIMFMCVEGLDKLRE
jgi:hypothetical protein